PFPTPYPTFYIGLLTHRLKIMFFLAKSFSILCLLGFLQIPLDQYEPRLAYLGMVVAITSYTVITFEWRQFEDHFLQFARALPISLIKRFLIVVSAYAMLLLPEGVVLLAQKIDRWDALVAMLLGVGFLTFAHHSLYRGALSSDRHLQRVLWLFLV